MDDKQWVPFFHFTNELTYIMLLSHQIWILWDIFKFKAAEYNYIRSRDLVGWSSQMGVSSMFSRNGTGKFQHFKRTQSIQFPSLPDWHH